MTASDPIPSSPPQGKPGYYPDNQGVMRWWTGHGWTDHIMGQAAVAQPPQAPKKKPDVAKVILISLGSFVALVVLFGFLGSGDGESGTADAPDDSAPTASKSEKAATPKKVAAATTVKDGDYLVGREIKIGTWKAAKVPDSLCYADTETKKGTILEQEVGREGESVIIRIKRNAYTFTSSGCGTWKKVD